METIGEIVKSLLGAEFPKVAGLFGFFVLFLGITPAELKLWKVRIPRRDRLGRGCSLVLGALFILVPLLSAVFGPSIGLINLANPQSSPRSVIEKQSGTGGLLFATALAQAKSIRITAGQRSLTDLTASFGGPPWAVYAGDVHLSDANLVLVFRAASGKIAAGTGYSEAEVRKLLPPADIIALAMIRKGDRIEFAYQEAKYALAVEAVVWYLIGDDTMTLSLARQ